MNGRNGERQLLAATLTLALHDVKQGHQDAWEWVDDDQDEPWSFSWTCEHLDLDPEAVRRVACTR